ncbi:GNAT family N-acetyltransferase [Lutibacter sp.]|uniref:GNAT family N-acetyltransferase n=1 Tax=Lutibacter sp. TaxID=1925666 RepID=UPI0034A0ABC1
MILEFSSLEKNTTQFFNMLPQDWQDIIAPQWAEFKYSASIYVFKENETIIAGGIVFKNGHPNSTDFENKFNYLYAENYYYIGFLWVIPEKRNQQLASKWLSKVHGLNSYQKFWLTIEEASLRNFYQKNGYKVLAENNELQPKEFILTYNPE